MKHIKNYDEYGDKMKNFIESLFEAMDNPYDVKYDFSEINNTIQGFFTDGKTDYVIDAQILPNDFYLFKFKSNDGVDGNYTTELNNNRGVAKYRVLATIKNSLDYIMDNLKAKGVLFGATDSSKGRKRLYDRYVDDYIKKHPNKDCMKTVNNDENYYLIHNIEEDREILINAIKYAYENNIM